MTNELKAQLFDELVCNVKTSDFQDALNFDKGTVLWKNGYVANDQIHDTIEEALNSLGYLTDCPIPHYIECTDSRHNIPAKARLGSRNTCPTCGNVQHYTVDAIIT